MTIYVQKVDEAAWRSDAPKSIGDAVYGLKSFRLDELAPMLPPMEPAQVLSLRKAVVAAGQSGLQVWGLPGGVDGIPPLHRDVLLLQEGAVIRYAGRVLAHFADSCPALSEHIWGAAPFGSIMLLSGSLARYPWPRLADELGFDRDDPQRRHVLRLTPARLALSPFRSSGGLLEALASGTPVVATPAGGIASVITDGENGLLVPERDAARLTAAIDRLLADRTFGAALGSRARSRVQAQHGWQGVALAFEAAYAAARSPW